MRIQRIDITKENIKELFKRFEKFDFAHPYDVFENGIMKSDALFVGDFGFVRIDRLIKEKCAFLHGMFDSGAIWKCAQSHDWYLEIILNELNIKELYVKVPIEIKGLKKLIKAFGFCWIFTLQTESNHVIIREDVYVYKTGGLNYVKEHYR
jgi:hypothetical protein